MKDLAISVSGVSKRYRVFENQRSRLIHALLPNYTKGMQEIWALKDISFEINRGDAVAIIGRNGGGKSTLLEILTGTLMPTTGTVKVNGRVSALLELGSGFKPEYSGRDNVILNGLLLGLSKDEILARFHEIESFAEIGAAIDRPVKTYSSGMLMRLAFAVQVLCEPDILIVDEALSVGDYFFQQKCFGRLRKMRDNGLTLLFVSHDMNTVRDLCTKAIYLSKGNMERWGDSKEVVRLYLSGRTEQATQSTESLMRESPTKIWKPEETFKALVKDSLWHREDEFLTANQDVRLLAVIVRDEQGHPTSTITMGKKAFVHILFRTAFEEAGHISLIIKNKFDQVVTNVSSFRLGSDALSSGQSSYAIYEFEIDFMIEAGFYSLMVAFTEVNKMNQGEPQDCTEWFSPLQICWDYESQLPPFLGMFGVPVCGRLVEDDQILFQREAMNAAN